jgi:NADH dehydrogenase FAD-containing subunit
MGGCVSAPAKAGKRVVIVGGSYAGYNIATQLLNDYSVTIVDKREYFDSFVAIPRALAVKDYYNEISVSYNDSRKGYANKFDYIQGELTTVNTNNTIIIKAPNGATKTITYDFLVLATGFKYDSPYKTESVVTLATRKQELSSQYEKAKAAKKILIVGTGAAGIEQAGELAHYYRLTGAEPEKHVTMVTRSSRCLATMPDKVGEEAATWLREHGVHIQYSVNYTPAMDKDYDFVIKSTGERWNSDFLKTNFLSSVAPNGQVFVNEYMQIARSDPRSGPTSAAKENVFAVGDCTWTQFKEEKNISSIMALAPHVGANIRSLDKNEKPTSKHAGNEIPLTAFISLGPEFAVMHMGGNIVASKDIGLSKAGILVSSMNNFRAPAKPEAKAA